MAVQVRMAETAAEVGIDSKGSGASGTQLTIADSDKGYSLHYPSHIHLTCISQVPQLSR